MATWGVRCGIVKRHERSGISGMEGGGMSVVGDEGENAQHADRRQNFGRDEVAWSSVQTKNSI